MGARPASSRAAILAESLGGERLGGAEGGEVPGGGAARRRTGEQGGGLRRAGQAAAAATEAERAARGGAAPEGSSSPVPSPPQLSSSRGGAGYVERGRAGSCCESGPSAPGTPALAGSRELCGGAAGVGAAERCMSGARAARRAAAVRSGACWSRREEASDEPGKREEGARAGRGSSRALARSFARSPGRCAAAPGPAGCSRWGAWLARRGGDGGPAPLQVRPAEGKALTEHSGAGLGLLLICVGV